MEQIFGLLNLYESQNPVVDIVFVHGLDGHRIITWSIRDEAADANLSLQSAETHDRNKMGSPQPLQSLQLRKRTSSGFSAKRQLCWPRDLLPMDVDDCRILSWGYDTSLISSSRLRVDDHAKSLLQDLTFARYKEFEVYRPIIFVAHSLGGIVVKSAISKSYLEVDPRSRAISAATRGVLFIGTPHHGLSLPSVVDMIRKIQSTTKLHRATKVTSGDLSDYATSLKQISENFIDASKTAGRMLSFYETVGSFGLGIIVDRRSAVLGLPQEKIHGLNGDHMNLCKFKSVHDHGYLLVVHEIRQMIDEINTANKARMNPCIQCLEVPESMEVSWDLTQKSRFPHTCEWVLEHPDYLKWSRGPDSKVLFVTGPPGSGKSTLMGYLLTKIRDHSVQHARTIQLYFFCNFKGKYTALVIIRSLLRQLLNQIPELIHVLEVKSLSLDGFWRDFAKLWEVFTHMIGELGEITVYCILDAIDEVAEDDALAFVQAISSDWSTTSSTVNIKVIASARRESKFISILSASPRTISLDLALLENQDRVKRDITRMLSQSVREIPALPSDQIDDVAKKLTELSQGSFLLSKFHSEQYRKGFKAKNIWVTIEQAAQGGIASAFNAVVDSIAKGNYQTIIQQALIWLVTAERPLTFDELDFVLRDQRSVGGSLVSIDFLKSALGPFLKTTGERVTLCHESAELYLKRMVTQPRSQVSPFRYDSSERNGILAQSCVRLLLQIVTDEHHLSLGLNQFIDDHSLARYAVTHFMDHVRSVKRWESSDWRLIELFFEHKNTRQLFYALTSPRISLIDDIIIDGLDVAVYFQLNEVVRRLLGTIQRAKDRGDYKNALYLAAEIGNAEIFQLLLDYGANPIIPTMARIRGLNLLHVAVKGQHKDIIRILIDHRLDIEDADNLGQTVLHLACQSGSVEIVRLLLETGTQIDKKSSSGLAPLHYAVEAGHGNVVKQLLDCGAKFHILNRQQESLLHIAARNNNADLVQLFLSEVYVNLQRPDKTTALHIAARRQSAQIVSTLLIAGADPQCQTKTGSTPLHEAAIVGAVDCARALIAGKAGKASLDQPDHLGRLPLHLAAEHGHTGMVALFLDHLGQEKSTTALTSCGRTALHHATLSSGCASVVELLVCHHKFDPNVKDSSGLTPLHEAVRYLKSAVELLLVCRGDPTIEDCDKRSPISFAVLMGSYDTLKLLLDASELDENTRGSTILQDALSRGQEDIIQLLLTDQLPWVACGAFEYLIDLRDDGYNEEELVRLLLEVQDSSPWIPREEWGEQFARYEPQIQCNFHQPSCAHTWTLETHIEIPKDSQDNPRWAQRSEEMIAKANRMQIMRNTICGLCGIGGVLPPEDTIAPSNEIEFFNGGAIITYDVRITTTDIPEENPESDIESLQTKDVIPRRSTSCPPQKQIRTSSWKLLSEPHRGFDRSHTTKITSTKGPSSAVGGISLTSQRKLVLHLHSIMLRIQEAINVLQTEGFCCDSFTVMSCSDDVRIPQDGTDKYELLPVISINTVLFSSIVTLADAIELASAGEDAQYIEWRVIAAPSLDILKEIQGQSEFASIWTSWNPGNLLDQVHVCSLAIQSICIGLASYAHAHAGKYYPFYLETPSSYVLLRGLSVDRPAVSVEPRQLRCMRDVIESDVLVFRFHKSGWAAQNRVDISQAGLLLASAETIADTWGATLFISNKKGEVKEHLVGIDINGGTIKREKDLTTSTGAALYHWYPYPSKYDNDMSFAAGEQILIGIINVNKNCPLNEELSRKASETQLIELGTADARWETTQRQATIQTGHYLTAAAGLNQTKLPHIPVKTTIFNHWAKGFDLEVLGAPWGLQVSLCTGVAQRVQLKNLLGKTVLAYLDNHHTLFKDWPSVREKATRGLDEELSLQDFHTWVQSLSEIEQNCVTRVVDYVLDKLRDTGVDRNGDHLSVWWPQPHDTRLGVRINAIEGRSWFRMLHESSTCAVFAAITTKCFENQDHPCRKNEVARWIGGGSMLQTAVHLDESGTCRHRHPRIQSQPQWRLEDGQTYWINKRGKCWVRVSKKRSSATTELEVKHTSVPSTLYNIVVKHGMLRERHTIHADAEEVIVKWPTRNRLHKPSQDISDTELIQ